MLYAFISDIHSNLHALKVVLEDIDTRDIDRLICLGDLVGYGAFPNEVCDLVTERTEIILAGNHDHAAVDLINIDTFNVHARNASVWTSRALTPENRKYLRSRPFTHVENDMLFVHSSVKEPGNWNYIFNDYDAESNMKATEHELAFCGHTHIPKDHQTKHGRMINVGSVGQPRDGNPEAAYTLFDTSSKERTLIRLEYDVDAAGQAIEEVGLPSFLAERLTMGR